MMTPPEVAANATAPIAVAILDHNGGDLVRHCAASFQAQSVLPKTILFIDNGSKDYDEGAIRAAFGPKLASRLRFLPLGSNLGYAAGFNRGLSLLLDEPASPPWVMTLNNDTELDPAFFQNMARSLIAAGPRLGMLAPKIRSMSSRETLDGTGLLLSLDGMSTARGQYEVDRGQYDAQTDILMPNGVSAVYRLAMLREIGLMDESFGSYCEDTDLGLRGWLAGWDCRYLPECVVYHVRSATAGLHSLKKLFLVERNHYWVAAKNFPLEFLALNPLFTAYRIGLQIYALFSRQGKGERFSERHPAVALGVTTLKAMAAAVLGLPRAFLERTRRTRVLKRSRLEILRALWKQRLRFHELILK